MHIHLEVADKNTIRSYSDREIMVDGVVYQQSVIISRESIITPWPVYSILELNETNIEPALQLNPEIIIIGYDQPGLLPPLPILSYLSTKRVGLECMSIGAASRTYNVLLSEHRQVIAGFIFP